MISLDGGTALNSSNGMWVIFPQGGSQRLGALLEKVGCTKRGRERNLKIPDKTQDGEKLRRGDATDPGTRENTKITNNGRKNEREVKRAWVIVRGRVTLNVQ